jgi:hypothetical protein
VVVVGGAFIAVVDRNVGNNVNYGVVPIRVKLRLLLALKFRLDFQVPSWARPQRDASPRMSLSATVQPCVYLLSRLDLLGLVLGQIVNGDFGGLEHPLLLLLQDLGLHLL